MFMLRHWYHISCMINSWSVSDSKKSFVGAEVVPPKELVVKDLTILNRFLFTMESSTLPKYFLLDECGKPIMLQGLFVIISTIFAISTKYNNRQLMSNFKYMNLIVQIRMGISKAAREQFDKRTCHLMTDV